MGKSDTIRIRPRRGVELAGIPADGADVSRELAEEWIQAGLATQVDEHKSKTDKSTPAAPAAEG